MDLLEYAAQGNPHSIRLGNNAGSRKTFLINTILTIMEKNIAKSTVTVNEEGYLTNFAQWNKEIAAELAKEMNIELTSRHWDVLTYLQNEYKQGHGLSIRH